MCLLPQKSVARVFGYSNYSRNKRRLEEISNAEEIKRQKKRKEDEEADMLLSKAYNPLQIALGDGDKGLSKNAK